METLQNEPSPFEVESLDTYAEQNGKAPFLSISASQLHNPTKPAYRACFTPRPQPKPPQSKDNSTNRNKEDETPPSHTLYVADQDAALSITIGSTPEEEGEKPEVKISSKSCKNLTTTTQQRGNKTESRKKSAEKKKKKTSNNNNKKTTTQLDWGPQQQEPPLCEYAVIEKPPQTPHIVDAFPVAEDAEAKTKYANPFLTGKPPVSPSKRGQRSASAQKRKTRARPPKKTKTGGKKEQKSSDKEEDKTDLKEAESNDSVIVTSLDIRDSIEVIPSAEGDDTFPLLNGVAIDYGDELDAYFTPSERAPTSGENEVAGDDVIAWEKLLLASFGSEDDDGQNVELSPESDDDSTEDDDWFNFDLTHPDVTDLSHQDLPHDQESSDHDEKSTEAESQVEKKTENICLIPEQPISITPISQLSVASCKNLRKGPLIGMGGFGKVWQGMTNEGHLIAIKQVELTLMDRKQAMQEYTRLQREVNILHDMRHPNIVSFIGTDLEKNVVKIYMEYLSGGSITSILKSYGPLAEAVFKRYTKQILEGVSYIHSENVVHRDINGNNIMLLPSGIIKLIDFGCAKRLQRLAVSSRHTSTTNSIDRTTVTSHKSSFGTIAGTPNWMAPEVITESRFGPKSDIWSVGCTVYEMATGKPPLHELEPISAIFHIGSNKPMPNIPDECSAPAHQLVEACLNHLTSYNGAQRGGIYSRPMDGWILPAPEAML